jgi:hypothetical protein
MSATYIYTPDVFEKMTAPDVAGKINGSIRVRLSKPPCGGKGLNKAFRWVEDMDGNFIGMVRRACLDKE